jgi:hypothetical protein
MKVASHMRFQQRFFSYTQSILVACAVTLLLAGCQSSSSSSSSSSTSTPSTSQSSQPSPSPSSSAPSSASSSSQEQQSQAGEQSGGEESSTAGGKKPSTEGGAASESSAGSEGIYGEAESGAGEILSEEEAVAILDEQLDTSITVFDDMIVSERVAAQSAADEFPEDDTVFGDDNPLFEEADISEDSDNPGGSGSEDAEKNNGDAYSESGPEAGNNTVASSNSGMNTNRGGARVPSDIPNGSDDDIVARQIREAAMKEQDPVLREKLWEEYRKYKRGQ